MRHTLRFSILLVSALGRLHGQEQPPQKQEYTGPRRIAEFCFDDHHRIAERDFVRRYGKPAKVKGVYCYRVPDQKLFARFDALDKEPNEIVEVFVSNKPNCLRTFSETAPPKLKFKKFATPEGINLGDSYSKVLATYGAPTLVEQGTGLDLRGLEYNKALNSAPFGDKVLIYSDSGDEFLTAAFYLRSGRVSANE